MPLVLLAMAIGTVYLKHWRAAAWFVGTALATEFATKEVAVLIGIVLFSLLLYDLNYFQD